MAQDKADYKTIVVGTDGSKSSLKAVERAADIAVESGAKLIVVSAYTESDHRRSGPDPDQSSGENYKTSGNAPTFDMLREAGDVARSRGAKVEEKAVRGAAIDVIVQLAEQVSADLVVVGDVGVKSVAGRLFGSVPKEVKRRAKTEVLIVETSK